MKRYRTYTAKKYKLAKRIIFFVIVALVIFGLTVLLGNHLKNKLESVETAEPFDFDTTESAPKEDKTENEESVPHDPALAGVMAGYLDLRGVTEEKDALAAVEAVRAAGYNAVCFVVTDTNGNITYASPAVVAQSRLPASGELIPYDILSGAANSAKAGGMRLSCVMTASDSLSDETVAAELAAMGFDEIIIRGFEDYVQLSNEYVADINGYVNKIRAATDGTMDISVSFAPDFFKLAQNAPYIEKIYNKTEFLAIDLYGFDAADADTVAQSLQGSISAYLLRPLLDGTDTETAVAVKDALTAAGVGALEYISAPEKISEDTKKADD